MAKLLKYSSENEVGSHLLLLLFKTKPISQKSQKIEFWHSWQNGKQGVHLTPPVNGVLGCSPPKNSIGVAQCPFLHILQIFGELSQFRQPSLAQGRQEDEFRDWTWPGRQRVHFGGFVEVWFLQFFILIFWGLGLVRAVWVVWMRRASNFSDVVWISFDGLSALPIVYFPFKFC
jgi:hypothetical protein